MIERCSFLLRSGGPTSDGLWQSLRRHTTGSAHEAGQPNPCRGSVTIPFPPFPGRCRVEKCRTIRMFRFKFMARCQRAMPTARRWPRPGQPARPGQAARPACFRRVLRESMERGGGKREGGEEGGSVGLQRLAEAPGSVGGSTQQTCMHAMQTRYLGCGQTNSGPGRGTEPTDLRAGNSNPTAASGMGFCSGAQAAIRPLCRWGVHSGSRTVRPHDVPQPRARLPGGQTPSRPALL